MSYTEQYDFWLEDSYFDEKTKEELKAIAGNEKEIEDRFYKELEFGTGGLRGVIGAGTNRMNIYTVRKATQGLANYIIAQGGKEKGVAIAYDSRRMSPEFADEAALCLAANGIKAYVFDALRPTPELSFALRTLHCISGIVITASHNPPEYNGYKAYWEDGAQVAAPRDKEIIEEVKKVTDYHEVKTMDKDEAVAAGLYQVIGKEIDDAYMAELKKQIIHPEIIQEVADDIKIVYSPFHGTGNVPVRRILSELGFKNVYVVPEQELPDPDFTTLDYPNPEDPKAFTLALALAKEKNADIVLATDPDADRLGIYALDTKSGEYIPFTGNMSGMLIAEYILRERTATKTMPENPALVTTIVTTNMAAAIARDYNVKFIEVLTGFKYIGEQIKLFEQNGTNNYVFGLEESYGCLAGTHARDKDAVVAVMCLCEMAAWCKKNGITVWDQMLKLYEKYGYFKETQYAITLKGIDGSKQIAEMMDKLRSNPPKNFGELTVKEFRDYDRDVTKDLTTEEERPTGLPKSNVLYFDLTNDSWCCARPSGTEPKIKFYMGVKGTSLEDAQDKVEKLTEALKAYL
ncbi:phospho-sugar mutase [Parablautia intestinalis]|jgi:phosphoglucomutase|uniref:Phosphoglucomutase n=1 Tax=Parablautia intestinalis TaxID=2320100 RepID=A0A3A9ART6_9FIRM|nr:phospho-sugar mutase [Parablautia intestinalis]MCI8615032.1 phospho-sugar mutase [Lachnospiraceae bacterium]MDE7048383.1 phospho-sugar mutase [Lachnospiraceae bacterium]RKI94098.1 phospho-sugar mutase [Parablautia intestinalis]